MNPLAKLRYQQLIRRARRGKRKDEAVQQLFNSQGIFFLPKNYHAALPTVEEIKDSFEYRGDEPPYLDPELFDAEQMKAFLDELAPFTREFRAPVEDAKGTADAFFWANGFFEWSDALAYYALLRRFRPRRVLEIGSGFSTFVAAAALAKNGSGELLCIEPYPRPFLLRIQGVREIIRKPVQKVPLAFFQDRLGDGDVLFIDSSHTVKTGSDCLYLYLKVLPYLKSALLIHSHDIFLPEAVPQDWQTQKHFYFTEQYLLLALLLGNPRFEVVYGTQYHRRMDLERLTAFNRPHSKPEGTSFWYRRVP
jgi:predicted O-methyltransferase YrrM